MRWTVKDKSKPKHYPQVGEKKIKKHFCLFPKHKYNFETKTTTWYWLESIYIVYEWVKAYEYCTPWGSKDIKMAHWEKMGIETSLKEIVQKY